MSTFSEFNRERFDKLSSRDRQMNIMSAIKAASLILQGSNVSKEDFLKYADGILEHYYQFDADRKASYQGNPAINVEAQKANQEVSKVVEQNKKEDKPF